jgi:hypothetical protein
MNNPVYINSTNIPPIMIINRIYETQKSSVAVACFLPGRAKTYQHPCTVYTKHIQTFTSRSYYYC